jgi:uncharacterized protein (UPF0332 family)
MNSQAFRQVDWCLKKAEKEIEECKKQKKKIRHRGLVKIEPNKKLAIGHLEKARHNLEAFRFLRKNRFSDWSVTLGFYTLYHCFLAIGIKYGYETRNQECTITLIQLLKEQGKISISQDIIDFMKYGEEDNSYEDSIIELREDYTYGIDLEIQNIEQLDKIEKLCIEFIDASKDIIYEEN